MPLDKDSRCAVKWADLAVALAPVSGRTLIATALGLIPNPGRFWDIFRRYATELEFDFRVLHDDGGYRDNEAGWLISRGIWAFIFLLTLCIALKAMRSRYF